MIVSDNGTELTSLLADFGEMKSLSREVEWIKLKRGWISNISCM